MGKRRIRNLQALGLNEIAGFDLREDRRTEAQTRYGVSVFETFENALESFQPTALIVSTEPRSHLQYATVAARLHLHCFIEASVVDSAGIRELDRVVQGTDLVFAPSCTMRYFPGPRLVSQLIGEGRIGEPLSVSYQTGQYLPDWHPWEAIQDFYVSRRDTGGCREIVPFELTWINEIFGDPVPLACVKGKLTSLDADIDDIYHCILKYPAGPLANIIIEVISRPKATRELNITGSSGRLVYSAETQTVRCISVGDEDWTTWPLTLGTVETGYINPEEPYISEMADFVAAIRSGDKDKFPNTLLRDAEVLDLLGRLEQISEGVL